eukprot:403373409
MDPQQPKLPDLTLFGDFQSQPTRAIFCFLQINKIPFKFNEISILHKQHLSPEYRKINPTGKVPAIYDPLHDIHIFESHAILRYLHQTRNCGDHWYPKDFKQKAKVEEYLDWHHSNLRQGAQGVFLNGYLFPLLQKRVAHDDLVNSHSILTKSLKLLETYWLADPSKKYLITNEITIADLSAACEIAQLLPLESEILRQYPKVMKWLNQICMIPQVKELHQLVLPQLKRVYKENQEYRAKL